MVNIFNQAQAVLDEGNTFNAAAIPPPAPDQTIKKLTTELEAARQEAEKAEQELAQVRLQVKGKKLQDKDGQKAIKSAEASAQCKFVLLVCATGTKALDLY